VKKVVNKEENEDQVSVEDLPYDDAQQDQVKGGSPGIGILRSTDRGSTWTV